MKKSKSLKGHTMFKSIIAAIALTLTVTTAQAAQPPVPLCTTLSVMAFNIAEARDKGLSRTNAIEIVVDTVPGQPVIMDFAIKTVYLAYEYPNIKPTQFGMVMLQNCLKVLGGTSA
jgi:hypothetical protein